MTNVPSRPSDPARLIAKDRALRPDLIPIEALDVGASIGLPPVEGRELMARNAILIELALASTDGLWLHYPRNRNVYAAWRRTFGKAFTYQRVISVVAEIERFGLIEHHKIRPGSSSSLQSRIRLRESAELISIVTATTLTPLPAAVLRLKDCSKNYVRFEETIETRRRLQDIHEHNEMLAAANLGIAQSAETSALLAPHAFCRRRLFRVFNVDWSHGGRWYGGWWQNMPSSLRALILINGQHTTELDFQTLHPRLLAAAVGESLDYDPYVVDGFTRELGKRAFNIALNAKTEGSATAAIARELAEAGEQNSSERAVELLDRLRSRARFFDTFWGKGVGTRLQCIDGDMCGEIQKVLRYFGIVALSVHDSFIVASQHSDKLKSVMDEVLDRTLYDLSKSGL